MSLLTFQRENTILKKRAVCKKGRDGESGKKGVGKERRTMEKIRKKEKNILLPKEGGDMGMPEYFTGKRNGKNVFVEYEAVPEKSLVFYTLEKKITEARVGESIEEYLKCCNDMKNLRFLGCYQTLESCMENTFIDSIKTTEAQEEFAENDKDLFRARRVDNGGWISGDLIHIGKRTYMHPITASHSDTLQLTEVIPSTICRFCGIREKTLNGEYLWENDLVHYENADGQVRFGQHGQWYGFYIQWFGKYAEYRKDIIYWVSRVERVGNIHDKPALQ